MSNVFITSSRRTVTLRADPPYHTHREEARTRFRSHQWSWKGMTEAEMLTFAKDSAESGSCSSSSNKISILPAAETSSNNVWICTSVVHSRRESYDEDADVKRLAESQTEQKKAHLPEIWLRQDKDVFYWSCHGHVTPGRNPWCVHVSCFSTYYWRLVSQFINGLLREKKESDFASTSRKIWEDTHNGCSTIL